MINQQDPIYFSKQYHLLRVLFVWKQKKSSFDDASLLFTQFGIQVLKNYVLTNLWYYKAYFTIKGNNKVLLQFYPHLMKGNSSIQLQKTRIRFEAVDNHFTQIEQMGLNKMIVSGGLYDNGNPNSSQTTRRFYILANDSPNDIIYDLNMISSRALHRTVFDRNGTIFIFSGKFIGNRNLVEGTRKCEACLMRNFNQFKSIKEIPNDSYCFGTSYNQSEVFLFGGTSKVKNQKLNLIQIYNPWKNS